MYLKNHQFETLKPIELRTKNIVWKFNASHGFQEVDINNLKHIQFPSSFSGIFYKDIIKIIKYP